MNLQVDLVSEHKWGLSLANPILVAAGFAGYGDVLRQFGAPSALGGLVTNPLSLRPWRGSSARRLWPFPGGAVLHTGDQNPGFRRVAGDEATLWPELGTAIIVRICGSDVAEYTDLAVRLEELEGVAALEVSFPWRHRDGWDIPWGLDIVQALHETTLFPLLVQLPIWADEVLAEETVQAGADVLVVADSPYGAMHDGGTYGQGRMYGPFLLPMVLDRLLRLAGSLPCPLIARGGVHTLADLLACLAAGAWAVQLDALLWRQPDAPWALLHALKAWMERHGITNLKQLGDEAATFDGLSL